MRREVAPSPTRAPSESGLALIVLLVVALFVGLVGVAMMNDTVSELQIAVNQSNAVQARYLAEAGIAAAVNQLSQDNTWVGPLTQSVRGGQGSYTVQVNTTLSNTALKVIDSTGSVLTGTAAGATQLVRETLLVLPQAFSKAMLSNTTITTVAVTGIVPTIQNTVLRQLGTMHANNLRSAATSVTLAAQTAATGQITASSGTITLSGSCIACAPANNAAIIPFPTFNFSHYITLAQANPSPCPGVQSNTFFVGHGPFDSCIAAVTADAQGFRTLNGIWFVQDPLVKLPNTAQEQLLKLNGSLIVYTTASAGCTTATPCGDLSLQIFGSPQNIVVTAQNGEPAIITGGVVTTHGTSATGPITVNGLIYILANTGTATASSVPFPPGYSLLGSSTAPAIVNGMVVAQVITSFNSNTLNYDPSSFFPGLPTGLVTPTSPPFILLPISWSSAK